MTMKSHARQPLVIYPNAGEDYDPVSKVWVPGTATNDDQMCQLAEEWIRLLGRSNNRLLLGGCCRTSPATISRLRKALQNLIVC
jgi:homocysteine S-methyltransferase